MHKDFPHVSEHELQWLKASTAASPAAEAALKKRQDAKIARETPIARLNESIYTIQGRTFQLMALSHDPAEYKELAETLVQSEKDRNGVFFIVIQAIGAEARRMTPEEAKVLYEVLRPAGLELKMQRKRSYVNYSRPNIKPDDISTYETSQVYPGIAVLTMLNRVATACHSAETPALKIPKEQEIKKYWADIYRKEKAKGKGR
jgi:hypothetical protein